eukprot:EG_transcript_36298
MFSLFETPRAFDLPELVKAAQPPLPLPPISAVVADLYLPPTLDRWAPAAVAGGGRPGPDEDGLSSSSSAGSAGPFVDPSIVLQGPMLDPMREPVPPSYLWPVPFPAVAPFVPRCPPPLAVAGNPFSPIALLDPCVVSSGPTAPPPPSGPPPPPPAPVTVAA